LQDRYRYILKKEKEYLSIQEQQEITGRVDQRTKQ
jgi:predicted Ser/Thr protein kinase